MSKSILITGGTGLIGRNLVAALEKQYAITVVSRDPARAIRLLGDNVKSISAENLVSVDEYDAIVNLAGEPIADKRWTDSQKEQICQSRWHITTQLVELINSAKDAPSVFISGSAVGVYGRQGDTVVDETFTDFHEEFSRKVCQKWEDIALKANTRVCIMRTGVVLSDEGGALAKMLMPFRLGLGGPIGTGKQFMPWIHIEDMVKGIQYLLNTEAAKGIYNFTSPNPNTNHFFSLALARRLERPCIFRVPAFAIKALMGESSDLVLYGQKVIPQKLIDEGFSFGFPTLKEALADLDL
ncbi:TIGR01777 family oxidoreductase [Glaciecola sp. MF2-115]|uniref:TIGR01777 family oxidoreductase n=1 Tax=Glaciecola sp. MF2-115 TaxID=3384827 RepID=UPI0039A127A0